MEGVLSNYLESSEIIVERSNSGECFLDRVQLHVGWHIHHVCRNYSRSDLLDPDYVGHRCRNRCGGNCRNCCISRCPKEAARQDLNLRPIDYE